MGNLPYILWAIPGFLGLPSDWDLFKFTQIKKIDVNSFSCTDLSSWAERFNAFVRKQPPHFPILLGYSMGGRLGLHALCQDPNLWKGGILISTHPGLSQENEKEKRLDQDEKWAGLFETEVWESLIKQWNAQDIFAKELIFYRFHNDYQRSNLAMQLRNFSLGKQEDLKEKIGLLPFPILWMTGEKDKKFSQLGQQLYFKHPLSFHLSVKGAGHRVPWFCPDIFKSQLSIFIEALTI
ncbi:Uncharacterized protein PRO82_000458 [Candidatus Protochlamydia amoebophila]|uniref:alpha/beta fold hydrolase n=1 Tax=Candidatus Protochlamydia amoebophila TaxID=362787 RepID=UPI001BCA65F0|nr:alpha/beta fold hydrolase [Candidatus Protochlamydia amoebophila]MBS4163160.1 Uncharacterized protein [Candidatus Protochlamydia amoebophila]